MTDPSKQLAAWLNATMQTHGLSQAELARAVGVADTQVSRWRRGQVVPTVRYLQRLADTFGVPRATLDGFAGYPVSDAPDLAAGDALDPERTAERQAYQAWFGHLLEQKLPRSMWQAYAEACEALADALNTSFQETLGKAREKMAGAADGPAAAGLDHGTSDQKGDHHIGFRS
jgi:transcriptional regulator with XRE-family HTH domain